MLDSTSHTVHVVYPEVASSTNSSFPLISYAHGDAGGGAIDITSYYELFNHIASFGYVIAAPLACDIGCKDDRVNLPLDPPGKLWA